MQFSFFITYNQREIPLAMVTEFFFIAFITVEMMFCFSYSFTLECRKMVRHTLKILLHLIQNF